MGQIENDHKAEEIPPGQKGRKSNPELRLWATHGREDVYFQREAQVNFWTVLGGLAMGALLTQLSPLLQEMQKSRWYLCLYLVASILVLSISWVQTSWGSLVLKWPISITSTIIMLFGMLAQSIQCLLITNPSGWLAATAVVVLFSLLNQFYFEKSGAWKVFPAPYIRRFKFNNMVYGVFLLICLAGSFQLARFPSRTSEMAWGCLAVIFATLALYMQHRGMQQEKRDLGIS